MNRWITLYTTLIGRILLGGFFLWSGILKALNFSPFVDFFAHKGYANSLYIALLVLMIEVVAGIALIADVKTRASSLLLAIYLLVWTCLFQQTATGADMQLFLENLAIVGGLLMAAGSGTSRWTPAWKR